MSLRLDGDEAKRRRKREGFGVYAVTPCSKCGGSGEVKEARVPDGFPEVKVECPHCEGKGTEED